MRSRVGIDIGGTFTDFALLSADGHVVIDKRLTTPKDPAVAVLEGLPALLAKAEAGIGDVGTVVHGTTLVTNSLIERRGARTAVLCTRGFADVFDIARERRYDMYDLRIQYPEPLVPRSLRAEVDERIDARGQIVRPLDLDQTRKTIVRLVEQRVEAIAICLLNSPVNQAHEQAIAELIVAEFPDLYVSASADIFPFIREYDRWTTASMNAFAQPMFDRYLDRIEDGLRTQGFDGELYVMSSAGGTVAPEVARRYPVRMLESGPAAGVLQAATIGDSLGHSEVLSFDMGGTTAKGALIRSGTPLKRYEMEVARVHEFKAGSGLPARIPVLDLIEIGSGGGSIAEIGTRGVIGVGPRSAGAEPGPACYGRGGPDATLTDANLLLGYLDVASFLGGEMRLGRGAAETAVAAAIAEPLGVDDGRAAWGIHETVNEDIARAFRNHASERGFDYRSCVMIAFGGSGPVHACRVARKLRVPTVIFPAGAGVMSAIGLTMSPLSFELLRSDRIAYDALTVDGLASRLTDLAAAAARGLPGADRSKLKAQHSLDIRYRGQGYEVEVALPNDTPEALLPRMPALFAEAYAAVFANTFPGTPIEILNWKTVLSAAAPADVGDYRLASQPVADVAPETRPVFAPDQGRSEAPVYNRYALQAGETFVGPAVVEERESTCVIGVGDEARVDAHGNLIVSIRLGDAG